MALDLKKLSVEDIEYLRKALGIKEADPTGRSARWEPLKDMRAPTTARGRLNRPHFEWSADPDPEGQVIPVYPRLYWTPAGMEMRVDSPDFDVPAGWTSAPPMAAPMTLEMRIQAEFAALSPEDQQFVLENQRTQRLKRLEEKMALMSNADMSELMKLRTDAAPKVASVKKSA